MREGVTYKRLTDVCGIQYGFAFDSKCFTSDDSYPPIIRIRDVVRGYSNTYYSGEINERYYVEKGDYLIGMDGEFNIATWQSDKALLNQRVCKIYSIDANTSIRYIYYALRKVLKQIEDETPFVTVKHLSASRLNKVSIALPSLSTQELIVRELDSISSVISAKKQQVLELDNLAQAIFLDTFGDPITNPKGWEVKKMSEVGLVKIGPFGSLLHKSDYVSGGIPLVNPVHMKGGYIQADMDFTITTDKAKELSNYRMQPNDFVFARRGDIGRCAIVSAEQDGYLCGTGSLFVRLTDAVNSTFMLYVTRSKSFVSCLNDKAKGATMQNINCGIVENLPIPLPPLSLQQAFAEKVQAIEEQKRLMNQSIAEFESLLTQRMEFHFA